MLLNHLPIEFSSAQFAGHEIAYVDGEQLRSIRQRLTRTHFVLRDGDNVLLFPYEHGTATEGTRRTFDTGVNFSVANALARNGMLLRFFQHSRSISGVRPVKFVKDNQNLLTGDVGRLFAICPEYSFDIRPLAPQDGSLVNGVLVNFSARFLVKPSLDELIAQGLDPRGLYVVKEAERESPYILPMFNRRLVGRIQDVVGGIAKLVDEREQDLPVHELHVEANLVNFEKVGRALLGRDYERVSRQVLPTLHKVSGAEKQLDRLVQLLTSFKDLQGDIPCCDGLTVRLAGILTDVPFGSEVGQFRKLSAPQCSLRPGGTITVPWPVDGKLNANGPFDADAFSRKEPTIGVLFPEQHKGSVEELAAKLRDGAPSDGKYPSPFPQGMPRKYRLRKMTYELTPTKVSGDRAAAYKNAALAAAQQELDLALVVISESDKALLGAASPYYTAKATLMSQGVPVQAITIETINRLNPYTLNNLALSLYAKLGGIPWTLSVQQRLVHEIIVGIGSARVGFDRLSERERLVGITTVFSGDGSYLLGNATTEASSTEYRSRLLESLRATLAELRRRFGWQRGDKLRIIFHQSYKRYKETEATAVSDLIAELDEFDVEFAFVQISSDHDWKLFDESATGVTYQSRQKGAKVPERGVIVPLGPRAALITLVGPHQLKTDLQGCPSPILVSIHPSSTFKDLSYVSKQVFDLTFMSWRSFNPSTQPVSVSYPNMVVDLLGNLRQIPNFNPDILTTKLRESRWFL